MESFNGAPYYGIIAPPVSVYIRNKSVLVILGCAAGFSVFDTIVQTQSRKLISIYLKYNPLPPSVELYHNLHTQLLTDNYLR